MSSMQHCQWNCPDQAPGSCPRESAVDGTFPAELKHSASSLLHLLFFSLAAVTASPAALSFTAYLGICCPFHHQPLPQGALPHLSRRQHFTTTGMCQTYSALTHACLTASAFMSIHRNTLYSCGIISPQNPLCKQGRSRYAVDGTFCLAAADSRCPRLYTPDWSSSLCSALPCSAQVRGSRPRMSSTVT